MSGSDWAFVRKELVEVLRDRKALVFSALVPILIYPALFGFSERMERRQEERVAEITPRVVVTGPAELLRSAIRDHPDLELVSDSSESEGGNRVEGQGQRPIVERLRSGEIDVWIDAPHGIALTGSPIPEIRIVYHRPERESRNARDRVRDLLDSLRVAERERRFAAAGGSGPLAGILAVREVDVATSRGAAGAVAGRFIPFLLIVTLFLGGAVLSTDAVAGEKERGTLETLYLTPVGRARIARAKFAVVAAGTIVSGLLSLASILVCYRLGLLGAGSDAAAANTADAMPATGLAISGAGIVVTCLLIVPLAILLASVLLGISAYARSFREALNLVVPVLLVCMIPGMLAFSQEVKLDGPMALVPVANVALAIRDGLLGPVPIPLLILVCAASAAWGLIALRWTTRMLSSEEVVLGFAPEPLLGRTRAGRRRAAYLGMALTVLIYFYVGFLLQSWKPVVGLAISLWVVLPALGGLALWLAWPGGRLAEILSLRGTGARVLAAAILLGAGSVVPIQQGVFRIQELFIPAPQDFTAGFDEVLGGMSTGLLLFLAAFSPAICEELVFRGAFLGVLRRTGTPRSAVLISSIFFGLIHLSVFRFLPTFLLGVIMAVLVARCRSLLPAVIFHLIYNGLSVIQLKVGESLRAAAEGPAAWALSALALAAGAVLLRSSRR